MYKERKTILHQKKGEREGQERIFLLWDRDQSVYSLGKKVMDSKRLILERESWNQVQILIFQAPIHLKRKI